MGGAFGARWLKAMVPILWIAGTVAALLGLAWVFQRSLIYLPLSGTPPTAALSGLAGAEEARVSTADGLVLGGWFVPARGNARAAVIVFNGNAGNRGLRTPLAERLAAAGCAVLLLDYRGYGGNPGRPTEAGLMEDGRAARRWIDEHASGLPVVYFGESLGAAVAVALAAERPPAGLVLRSPFTSLVEIGQLHYPWLPVRWLLSDRWASIEQIRSLRCPLLVVAGERDRIVPARVSRALYDAAPGPDKSWLAIGGADHNDQELLAGDELIGAMTSFIERSLGAGGSTEER